MTFEGTDRERGDVVALLERQHAVVRDLLASLRAAPDPEVFATFVRLLVAHETAEEIVVYPVVRSELADGAALADARAAEERATRRQLAELESVGPDSPEFPALLATFADDVLRHAANEERHVLPLLTRELSERRRHEMALDLHVAESTAPTHAHRRGPTGTLGNLVVTPVVSLVDRVRDAFRARRAS